MSTFAVRSDWVIWHAADVRVLLLAFARLVGASAGITKRRDYEIAISAQHLDRDEHCYVVASMHKQADPINPTFPTHFVQLIRRLRTSHTKSTLRCNITRIIFCRLLRFLFGRCDSLCGGICPDGFMASIRALPTHPKFSHAHHQIRRCSSPKYGRPISPSWQSFQPSHPGR